MVLEEYKPLIMTMNNDLHVIPLAKKTLEFLCDVEVVMGLKCIMPMLEIVLELIKFAQSCVILFVTLWGWVLKMCCVDLYTL
jgi:hypothetical protein